MHLKIAEIGSIVRGIGKLSKLYVQTEQMGKEGKCSYWHVKKPIVSNMRYTKKNIILENKVIVRRWK